MPQWTNLVLILSPLLVGFLWFTDKKPLLNLINKTIDLSVYIILLLMGMMLAQIENLFQSIIDIALAAGLFLGLTLTINIIAMLMIEKHYLSATIQPQSTQTTSLFSTLWASLKMPAWVLLGFALAALGLQLPHQHLWINGLLMLMLFLIGIQLRSSHIRLRDILLNHRALIISAVFIAATLIGGVMAGLILGIPVLQSLALASGFGWYSLSGSLMTQAYGPFWGTVALINDLGRELFALMFIPMLMRICPAAAVSSAGATALDFTLPILHRSGGVAIVPLAISFGFIVNIAAPVLMIVLSSWH